jgi:hypothetical protein
MTPEAEAVLASAPVNPDEGFPEVDVAVPVTTVDEPGDEEATVVYPISYYNPKVLNERFYIPGNPYPMRFTNGRYVAKTAQEELAVRKALAAYGRLKPDRWRGDDRSKEWVHRSTGFRTFNEAAREDFEFYHD